MLILLDCFLELILQVNIISLLQVGGAGSVIAHFTTNLRAGSGSSLHVVEPTISCESKESHHLTVISS